MTDDIREKAIEAAARAAMKADGCGLTIEGEHVFCDDPRADREIGCDVCLCKRGARAAIAAYERAMWRPIEEAPIEARRASPPMLLLCPGVTSWNRYNNASDMIVGAWNGRTWESDIGDVDQGYESSGAYFEREALHPTHFRPLPLPPENET